MENVNLFLIFVGLGGGGRLFFCFVLFFSILFIYSFFFFFYCFSFFGGGGGLFVHWLVKIVQHICSLKYMKSIKKTFLHEDSVLGGEYSNIPD